MKCGVGDIFELDTTEPGSGCNPDDTLKGLFLGGIGVVALLLLLVVLILSVVCCLGCKIRKLSRRGLGTVTSEDTTSAKEPAVAENTTELGGVQLEGEKAPQMPAPETPDSNGRVESTNVIIEPDDTMYDSIEDIKLVPLKQKNSNSGKADLPDYDTISFEKLEISVGEPKSSSSSEAPPTKPEDSSSVEYSVVMKKTKTTEARSATDKVEEYNVLVHNTTPAPGSALNSQPRQTVVTYASLNKTLSGDGAELTSDLSPGEVPPPPVPPPISKSDLLAISGGQEPGQTPAATLISSSNITATPISTEKNISYQNCPPAQQGASSISGPAENQEEGREGGREGGGDGEGESLYMNT